MIKYMGTGLVVTASPSPEQSETDTNTLAEVSASEVTIGEIVFYIIVIVILAQFWLRPFQNLLFETLGYSETSLWVAAVIGIVVSIFAMVLIFNYPRVEKGIITQRGFAA